MKDKNKSEEMKHATDMLLKERNFISAILETTGALVVLFDNCIMGSGLHSSHNELSSI